MKLAKNQAFMHKPLRDILLNREELVQHGKEIARTHLQSGTSALKRSTLPHVADNMDFLSRAQAYISTYLKETNDIVPAAEWFLDNYYLLKDLGSEIAEHMPRKYEKQLPRLSDGPFHGYPRVLALMVELIEHTDSHLQLDAIKEFVEAYQTVAPLSSGEIWAIPIMLRIALLENIRRLVERVIYIQDQRQAAERWLFPFLETEHEADKWDQLLNSTALPDDFSTVFAERLLRRLRDFGQDAGPVLSWLDKQASKTDSSLEALAKLEHQNQAMLQVTMGHAITSLRFTGEEDWPKFFEQISTVEQILQQDPAQVYCKMDFESRDQYRHKVERLARHFAVSEIVIAKKVLELATLSQEHSQTHVGYFLLGKGMQVLQSALEQEWGALRQYCIKIKKFICSKPVLTYLGGIASLTVLLLCVGLVYAASTHTAKLSALVILGVVLLIPLSSLALTLVNWAVTRLLKPSFLPKLDLNDGIPPDLKTMVVIPTLLSSVSRVRELTEQIEVYYLANQDTNLHFAILGDFIDAPDEVMPDDEAVITTAVEEIKRLNDKYDSIQFHLFNRKRLWNPAEGVWMGWERKRGKLVEFNRLLSNNSEHSFDVTIGHAEILSEIKYIITLDADTQLPREAAKKLIGTIAHPLQSPILNAEGTRVIDGYGIIQPRIAVSVESAEASFFAKVFAGRVGVDPYTAAVSDVYQDLFGEGNFTGKGIYDVEVFHKVTGDIFPQNTILSHDLIEGIYGRTGLVTDIELIDGYPSKVHAYMRRIHRWVRGDWQITPWLFKRLPVISRWKIGDNLRRSLEAPALVVLIVFSAVFPGSSWAWLCLALLALLLPCVLGVINSTLNLKAKTSSAESVDSLLQFVFMFCFLPYQAYTQVDAIIRSLYRQTLTRRKMLEWEAAADTELRLSAGFLDSCKIMAPALIATGLLFLVAFEINPQGTIWLFPIIALWLISPWIAATISRPRSLGKEELSQSEKVELRGWARRIWAFFEDFVTEKDNWLPPDNLQVEPPNGVAHRTSPTNIGLALLANQAARDLGYLSTTQLLTRVRHTLNSIDSLENWKGHLYNWYDTESLKPLHPLYVSTVDSGNLVVYFLTLEAGLKESLTKPVIDTNQVNGLKDTYNLLAEELSSPVPPEFDSFARSCDQILQATNLDLLAWYNLLVEGSNTFATSQAVDTYWGKHLQAMLADFLQEFNSLFSDLLQSGAELTQLSSGQISSLNLNELDAYFEKFTEQPQGVTEVRRLKTEIRELRAELLSKAMSTDFLPLFDTHRQLFSIGYRIGEQTLDKSYYDLLASEARQASFIAIAKGDLAKSHWFRLGRSLTGVRGKRSLVSWSGTMFEFLMPLLVMRNYQGTILDETYKSVVAAQEWYGAQRKTPWGISESGFYAFDAQLNYQYKAFGVPGLGLKRGLLQELVVAPYATFLALMVAPKTALANIRAMKNLGFDGLYGLYEAADYSQDRTIGSGFRLVQSFMAHHQGMSFISLTNVLFDNIMQKRFHALPLVQSTELLLKERVPATGVVTPQPEEREIGIDVKAPALEKRVTTLSTAETSVPVTHFLSNGQYAVMLTNSGSGYSKFAELSISRWREDVTKDSWGMYFYIQNLNSGAMWSAAHQPCGYSGEDYKVTYAPDRAEYYRKDGNIRTKTEVIVSPEDQVEIRRISLTNNSQYDRTIEVTSYFEVVLARPSEDLAHPAFGNLFIETEFTHQSLLASRRPRRDDQARKWVMQTVAVQGESIGALQYETDRYKFVGRGRNLTNPKALEPNHPLSGTTGAVLDPILSLRQRVRLRPGQSVQVSFSVGIGESKEEVIRLAEKYRDTASIERVFELAWTYSQMELRHLGLASNQANDALSLGGNLLYLSPCRREYEEVIKSNCKGQSSLWPYAISGDLPMILVRISKIDHLDFVSQLLTIHEYWHIKGLVIDLVILNEDKSGYLQDLHDSLKDLVAVGHAREMLNRPGGIFLLQKEHMPLEDVNLIFSVARQVFSAEGGSCSMQFRKLGKELLLAPKDLGQSMELQVKGQDSESTAVFPATEELEYYNGYGGFSKDGREYVILVRPNNQTPLPWSNVIANKHFGFLITESGGGYTWSTNSRENKLTPWSNDPVIDQSGEIIFLRDEQSGSYWSPIPGSIKQQEPYTVRHGQGYSRFTHVSRGLRQELLLFVPKEEPVKILQLTLTNLSKEPRTLTGFYYAELVMGVARELTAPYLVSEFDSENNCLLAANVYQQEFARRRIFLSCTGAKIKSYTADRTEFIGRNGNAQRPAALSRSTLLNSVGAGFDPCAAIQIEINLVPGECKTVCFLLGEGKSLAEVEQLLHRFQREDQVTAAFAEVEEFWTGFLGNLQVRTPDKSMDILLNRWLLYQTVVCRLWARSAFYQSGGAFGFRDQLQDVMALTPSAPQWTREQILLHCEHQFLEGDVQHWWHAEGSKGIRTKFSDDLLWLPFVTADYIEHTQDYGILMERAQYLEDDPLAEETDERYSIPRVSEQDGTVYEHCLKAIERGLKFGAHGLPLIGSGDWNDGFSRVGVRGRGESVWLGWFIYLTLQRFAKICAVQGDTELTNHYAEVCSKLQESLELHGWDGGWYRRAYFDDGSPMGSARNKECQIDALAQSWAVLSGAAKPTRAEDAMLALEHYLIRKDEGILLLLTPPFDTSKPDPGYIKGYVPGVRENGGQYTHGSIWSVLALAKMGEGDRAAELFQMLNPINHARTETEVAHYKVEPYVMTADVYAIPPHVGRGGWSWYTGAAGWMYQAGLEGILGFYLEGHKLYLEPCIPSAWPEFTIEYKYKTSSYTLQVNNPNGKNTGISGILVDGKAIQVGAVELVDDGSSHSVTYTM
jgi:cyclic beta-1,2-glucan synthetase